MKRAFARRVSGVRSKIRWKMNRYKPSYDDITLGFHAFPDSTGLFSVGTKRRRTKQKQWNVETHRLSAKFHDWNGIRSYVCALFKSTPSVSSCCFFLRHNWLVILLSFLMKKYMIYQAIHGSVSWHFNFVFKFDTLRNEGANWWRVFDLITYKGHLSNQTEMDVTMASKSDTACSKQILGQMMAQTFVKQNSPSND